MKYSIDPGEIISEFSKRVLTHKTNDEAIAYLLRDLMEEKEIYHVSASNRLLLISFFQDVFDVINPYIGNIFSAFDVDFFDDGFEIQFMVDFFDIIKQTGEEQQIYRDTIKVEYLKNRSK